MRALCICLAPAVDATVRLPVWPSPDAVIKGARDTFVPGGKALNVARWLAKRGASVACTGILGADNASVFARELAHYGIEDRFVRIPGATRVNEMFVTAEGSFKVNRVADCGPFTGVDRFCDFAGFEVVVMSGSLPEGWSVETYRLLIERAKASGAVTVLDASGAALREGVKARPDVIKPNDEECAALVGSVPKTADDFRDTVSKLHQYCDFPIVSSGKDGCWFDGEHIAAPSVEVLDTTAAGDTLLAEWCWRRFGDRPEGTAPEFATRCAKWAVAAGSAACMMPGGEPPPFELVESLLA